MIAHVILALFLATQAGAERQEHQWILKTFGFVHRDHLYQVGIALQAHIEVLTLLIGTEQHRLILAN